MEIKVVQTDGVCVCANMRAVTDMACQYNARHTFGLNLWGAIYPRPHLFNANAHQYNTIDQQTRELCRV